MSEVRPAATVVLVRDGHQGLETLLLRRNSKLAFAGDSWVFPGGRVDDIDHLHGDGPQDAARQAAVREAQEEAGLHVDIDSLLYFAHWTTPEQAPKRYATWFFVSDIFSATDVAVDGSEIVDYLWVSPADAIQKLHNKQIKMMPPTFITLQELSSCADVGAAMGMYSQRKVIPMTPRVGKAEDGVCMLYPGDAGYENADTDVLGSRHRFWMLKSGWRYEKD